MQILVNGVVLLLVTSFKTLELDAFLPRIMPADNACGAEAATINQSALLFSSSTDYRGSPVQKPSS
jgi:hypothetical protein